MTASASAIKGRSGTALFTDLDITFECNCPSVDILDEGRINEIHFTILGSVYHTAKFRAKTN